MQTDAHFWDGMAERYAAKPVDNPDAFERKIAITKTLLTPDSVVLDVGCGTGSLALILAPHARQVHGLDVSQEMIRIARGKATGVDNVTFHRGVVEDAPFGPESLDVVMGWSLLHLVPDRMATLRAMYDRLVPGGAFVASTVVLGQTWVPYGWFIAGMRLVGRAPYVAILDIAELEADIRAAGFVDLQSHEVGASQTVVFHTARKP